MNAEPISNYLSYILEKVIILLILFWCFQSITSLIISVVLSKSKLPINKFYYGYILGTSIRRVRLQTNWFNLNIGRISFTLTWKPSIIFHDVELEVLADQKDQTSTTNCPGGNKTGIIPNELKFTVNKKLANLLRWASSFTLRVRRTIILLPKSNKLFVNLSSFSITIKSNNTIIIETFLYECENLRTEEKLNHAGFVLDVKVKQNTQNKQTNLNEFSFYGWNSAIKIADLHLLLPNNCNPLIKKNDEKINTLNKEFENIRGQDKDKTKNKTSISDCISKYSSVLKKLNVFDIKVENLNIKHPKDVVIKISSIQLYSEAIENRETTLHKSFFTNTSYNWGEYELSLSMSSIIIKIEQTSTLRIPLINVIVASNVFLYFLENIPLNKTYISCTTNIINPSIYSTMDQIISLIERYSNYLKTKKEQNGSKDNTNNGQSNNILENYINNYSDLRSLPTFSNELTISNFITVLQITLEKSLTFKIFNTQALLGSSDQEIKSTIKDLVPMKQQWSFTHSISSTQKLSKFVKIIGTELAYIEIIKDKDDNEISISIPICGFERIDTFVYENNVKKFIVELTVRHFYVPLEDLRVLDILNVVLTQFIPMYKRFQTSRHDEIKESVLKKLYNLFQWSYKLRFKDIECSLIISKHLPRILDSVELDDFNLSDVERGIKVVCSEAYFMLHDKMKRLTIVDAVIVRAMDDKNHDTVYDNLLHFKDLIIENTCCENFILTLPALFIKFDVNLIWLGFYLKSIITQYTPKINDIKKTSGIKKDNYSVLSLLHVEIQKIVIDINLPNEIPLLFILESIVYDNEAASLLIKHFSVLVQSVYYKQSIIYSLFLTVKNLCFDLNSLFDTKEINITTDKIHFRTEYHFKIYTVFDNIVTMYKAFKQLKLSLADVSTFSRLYPQIQQPKELPNIRCIINSLLIHIDEDPFEQELGLIFKVGLLEQRERSEKYDIFEETFKYNKTNSYSSIDSDIPSQLNIQLQYEAHQRLLENFSTSWITRYKQAKHALQGTPSDIKHFEDLDFNYYVVSRVGNRNVAKLVVDNLDLKFAPPSFPVSNYSDFLFKYGKGMSKNTEYTFLILMGICFKTGLWQLTLRDYPIPVLSFPNTNTVGDIVFSEQMPIKSALHTFYVPFVLSANNKIFKRQNTIFGSHIIRTMNSIKTIVNCKTTIDSKSSVCITWAKSFQPGFESLMLWFDYLTKPAEDPSPKLGFWDKFRFLFHGKWVYEFLEETSLHLNIKGARNPYNIVDEGAGFTFCWNGNTTLNINDTPNPKEFVKIESDRFLLGVRDFTIKNKFDKILTRLHGNVIWKMGMLFEEGNFLNPGDEERFSPTRPHYDIQLVNPKKVENKIDYDSYKGFRSTFIHASFGVFSSQKNSNNSLYIAPQTATHFLKWWKLFNTYSTGPIRQGPLFTDSVQNKRKFGRSLFTIKYQLHLEPLNIAFVYQHILGQYLKSKDSKATFTGLKGIFKSVKIDLHQRKQKLTHSDAKLNKTNPVWKFTMSNGEMDCREVDIRVLSTVFDKAALEKILLNAKKNRSPAEHLIDTDILRNSEWYDFEDYVDLDQFSLKSSIPLKLQTIPLLYSPRISYFRKLNEEGIPVDFPFGGENSHDCIIGRNHPERTQQQIALSRRNEIEQAIKNVEFEKNNLSTENPSDYEKRKMKELSDELHELAKRLKILNNILRDLKISGEIDEDEGVNCQLNMFSNSSHDSLSDTELSLSDLDSKSTCMSFLRTNTVESFMSLRQVSAVKSISSYDNKFIVHNIQLKLNKRIRDHLIEYANNLLERRTMRYALSYKSVKIFKNFLGSVLSQTKTNLAKYRTYFTDDEEDVSNTEFIKEFEKLIKEVPDENFDAIDSVIIKLVSPQIQFTSDLEPETAVILAARDIEVGIIDINQISDIQGKLIAMDVDTIVQTRYCAVAKDVQIFTLFKKDVMMEGSRSFQKNGYGMDRLNQYWPPWIPLEMCFDNSLLEKHKFLKRRSMFMTFTAPNPLYFNNQTSGSISKDSKVRIGFPGLSLTSTSKQYNSFYSIFKDLATLNTQTSDKIERLAKVLLADEIRNNLDKLDISVITKSQNKIKKMFYIRDYLKTNNPQRYAKNSTLLLNEIESSILQLTILIRAIKENYNRIGETGKATNYLIWQVGTDKLIWKLYDDYSKPFVTIGLSSSIFVRKESNKGVITNKVAISTLKCFNMQDNSIYLELLAPFENNVLYDNNKPMVNVSWIQKPAIGGITNLEELIIFIQPIIFRMDNKTGENFMKYLFPEPIDNEDSYLLSEETNNIFSSENFKMYYPKVIRKSEDNIDHSNSDLEQRSIEDVERVESWDLSALQDKQKKNKTKQSNPGNNTTHKLEITNSILKQKEELLNEMLLRAGNYFNVDSIVIKKTTVIVSYKGSNHLLTDVDNLLVRVPEISYKNKIWSRNEFFGTLKKDIIKVVVSHLGSIIGNKLIPHKKENKFKSKLDMLHLLDSSNKTIPDELHLTLDSRSSLDHTLLSVKRSQSKTSHGTVSQDESIQVFYPEQ